MTSFGPGTLLVKWAWRIALLVVSALFVSRFVMATVCGIHDWPRSLINFGVCLALIYLSFIVEGIILAIAKIEDYDDEATVKTFRQKFGPADVLGPSLVRLKHDADPILVGQPLFAIAIAFTFNELLQASGVPAGATCAA